MTRPRSFTKGVLAHLILVPAWVFPPIILLTLLVVAGSPHGLKGIFTALVLGAGLFQSKKVRPPVCILLISLAGYSGSIQAIVAAVVASFLCWLTSRSQSISPSPALFDFISTWAPDFYAETFLGGHLDDIKTTKSFFGFHPHGCLCTGFTINGCWNPEFLKRAGNSAWLCDGNLRHNNPGFRLMSEGYRGDNRRIEACDRSDFKQFLSCGLNVAFHPGGFLDTVAYTFGKDRCVLRSRKGFIKYCLQYGYRLHPVYTFGESETFFTFTGFSSLRMKIAKQNIPAAAFFGWPFLPCLPRPQARIKTFVGRGIDLPQILDPSNEDVDHWHKVYMEALLALFNEYKVEAGHPHAVLEIV